ncbi:penicillin acylase family protein [Arthrobacter sp. K5]|uniref:Penicillin acylase family protein n=1 Tax=Arthrobacter sp. K5 TaxID=2839623 RepID=A0AAU8EWG8_9MICC
MNEETFFIQGTRGQISVAVDEWGVPHIEAGCSDDVFFGQGFITARNRMFQLDWWRRKGLGKIAEVLGPDYIERDRAARLFLYRGDMRAEWLAYGNDTRQIVESFTAGINAWIDLTKVDPSRLSPEFELLGYQPDHWEPSDITRIRSHGLYANLEQEVKRAITIRDFGLEAEELRRHLSPPVGVSVPEGLDLSLISEDILAVYRLATGQIGAGEYKPLAPEGSNNWVVSGNRTATGRPLLANDPHRAMTAPSLRQIVHLKCPEFDVIGAGEPQLPGVSIGHNGAVAFGLTIWNADQEDLYVYELHPDDPSLYRYDNSWVRTERVVETIAVRDSEPVDVELEFTRHGPIIHTDADRMAAFAVRAAWLEPGMAPYLTSLQNLKYQSADDVRSALNRWGAPGVNHVYADVDGSIGWSPRALVPVRPNWNGLLPVPGDGRYEWAGFQDASALPNIIDPERGWVASANEMNLPDSKDWNPVEVSYEWYASYRMERISEVLDSNSSMDVAASMSLQNDYASLPAREICSLLPEQPFESQMAEIGRRMLRAWDARYTAESGAATLFERWVRGPLRNYLLADALEGAVEDHRGAPALAGISPSEEVIGDLTVDMRLFRQLAHNPARLHAVMEETLAAAVVNLQSELGQNQLNWEWGNSNQSLIRHPLFPILGAREEDWLSLGPRPKSGNSETVGLAAPTPATGVQATGASFRVIVDVGEWDRSVAINTPGQDGDPRSPHYSDLYDLWLKDGYFPLLYSHDAVEAHTITRIRVCPSP